MAAPAQHSHVATQANDRDESDVGALLAEERERLMAETTMCALICGWRRSPPVKDSTVAPGVILKTGDGAAAGDKSGAADGKEKEEPKSVSFLQLVRFADTADRVLYVIAGVTSLGLGAVQPMFALLFGTILDSLYSPDPSSISSAMDQVALYFVYIGLASFFLSVLQTGFVTIAAERQIGRVREAYLGSLLRQEVAYFETDQDPAEVATQLTEDTVTMLEGVNENVTNGLQAIGASLVGIAVGFAYSWDLSLIVLCIIPVMFIPISILGSAKTTMERLGARSYARSGSAATEAISNIRTVVAFNGQEAEARRYSKHLGLAGMVIVRAGMAIGFGVGLLWLVMVSGAGGCRGVGVFAPVVC